MADFAGPPLRIAATAAAPLRAGRPSGAIGVAPEMVAVHRDHLELADGRLARTFAVRGYPREVETGWLRVLEAFEGECRFAQHIEPLDSAAAMAELGRDLRALRASLLLAQARGTEEDATDRAAADDAADLQGALARGDVRLFAHHLLITVFAADQAELEQRSSSLITLLEGRLIGVRRCLLEQEAGFLATMPLGRSALACPRNFDSEALSAALPPLCWPPVGQTAEVWGLDARRRTLVAVDRFALPNPHALCLAGSGAGKSYWLKNLLTQNLLAGRRAAVFDPQGEYGPWCAAVGGAYVRLGAGGSARLSPLCRPQGSAADAYPDDASWRAACVERLVALLEVLVGAAGHVPPPTVWAALDAAVAHTLPAEPTLTHIARELAAQGPEGARCAQALAAALRGGLRPFDGVGVDIPQGPAVVFDLRDVLGQPPAVVAAAFLLLTHHVLDHLVRPEAPPLTVAVDEAHHLLAHAATARFLDVLFRTGRKRGVAVCLATQSVGDLLPTAADAEAARAARGALANAAVVFLMRQQNGRELGWLTDLYRLGPREAQWLTACGPGDGLLIAGQQRALVRIEVPEALRPVFSTGPPGARPP
ncbi:MAG TPA: hypothetical protein VNM16_08865 [Bacillota bacterium]|nr:hypothetical protein [Bacillota bacterium]